MAAQSKTTVAGSIRDALAGTGWAGLPLRDIVEACRASGAIASWKSPGEAIEAVESAVLRLESRGEVFATLSSGRRRHVSSARLASAQPPEDYEPKA